MLEMGQPLHAFDYDRLAENRIVVRRARPDEWITTIDGQPRELDADMLVIADAEQPVALAGVMGGEDSEVTGATVKPAPGIGELQPGEHPAHVPEDGPPQRGLDQVRQGP